MSGMEHVEERKFYLQLWAFTTGPAIDVMQMYFECNIIHKIKFETFLNNTHNKHVLFHQCVPEISCCECNINSLASPGKKGCLNKKQFYLLFDDTSSPKPNHEKIQGTKVTQYCLCKLSAKISITVDCLDITLFNDMVRHCCPSKMNALWLKKVKDVRNFLAHVGNGQVAKSDFQTHWDSLEVATIGFATEVGSKCMKMFTKEISQLKRCSIVDLKEILNKSNDQVIQTLNVLKELKPLYEEVAESKSILQSIQLQQFEQNKKVNDKLERMEALLIGSLTNQRMKNLNPLVNIRDSENSICSTDIGIGSTNTVSETLSLTCEAESTVLDEDKALRQIMNIENIQDEKQFEVIKAEKKCLLLHVQSSRHIFESVELLRYAIMCLIERIVKAGDVDLSVDSTMNVNITLASPVTEVERNVICEMLSKYGELNGNHILNQTQSSEADTISVTTECIPNLKKDIETTINQGSFKTSSQVVNQVLVDKKVALQKLGEIPLVEHQIKKYKESIKEIEQKWLLRHLSCSPTKKLKTKEWTAKLKSLDNEKWKRTSNFEKLKDIICKKEDVTFTEKTYGEDLGFLNGEMKAVIKCQQCDNEDESQISCYCGKCKIFLCDICENRHRLDKTSHCFICKNGILRSYKLNHCWSHLDHRLIDIKCVNTNTLAVLTSDMTVFNDENSVLATYNNVSGDLENKHIISSINIHSKIARINDSMVAITNTVCNLINTATIQPTIEIGEVRVSIPIEMTGGIECRSNILYVACTDAIRLIDLSGQVQSSIDVQNVGILHFLNSDKILCVDSYFYAKRSVSCIDLTNNSISKFINFPFYPDDITSDDVGNIIFRADYLIWQADSDGNNFKVIMSPASGRSNEFNGLSYDKFSKTLITSNSGKSRILLYNKLEKM